MNKNICTKDFFKQSKRCRDGWMKLLANKAHIQGMKVLLADKVHKQEPNVNGYTMLAQKERKQKILKDF